MKTCLALAMLGLTAWWAAATYAATSAEDHAAEMKECAVCKFMAEDPALMKAMTWECHKINDGMICVATVPKDMKEKFNAVQKKMLEAVAHLAVDGQNGEHVELCTFCEAMGDLTQAGADRETVDTATGSICLVTSDDPAVVAKIHAQAKAAMAEQEAAK